MEKFREDLKIIRQVQSGEVSYVVKDPVAQKYFRFGELEVSVFKHLDGLRSYDEIAVLVAKDTGTPMRGEHVAGFVETIKSLNFIQRSASEKSLMMLEHLREERQQKVKIGAEGRDLFYQRFPLWDPDQLYNRLMKRIWFLWSRQFVVLCLVLFSLAAVIIISNLDEVGIGLAQLRSFESLNQTLTFIGVLLVVIVFHENGHGLTCKRYGGEVHEVGFMLMYFMPAFYANVSDAWTFTSKAAKLWVTFAGAFVELVISSIACFIWYFSAPGYLTHDLAFTVMLVSGLSSIMINMNPLIKLDGYFALVDYLEVAGLSDDSARYVSMLVRKHIFRMQVSIPDYKPRLKRILLIYGVLAICYRIFFLTVVLLLFNRLIRSLFPEAGVFIFPFIALVLLRKRLGPMVNGLRRLYVDKKELLMKPKSLAIAGAAMLAVVALLFFVPFPYSHEAEFVIEPAERIGVRAAAEGFLRKIAVNEGDHVAQGAVLAILRNGDLEEKEGELRAQIAVLDRRIVAERARGGTAESLELQRRRTHLDDELIDAHSRLQEMVLTAPVAGTVVTPKLDGKVGMMLRPGEEFCQLDSTGKPGARVIVDDWDLKEVETGARATLRLNSDPAHSIAGRVSSVAPASELHERLADSTAGKPAHDRMMVVQASAPPATNRKLSSRQQAEAAAASATSPFDAPLTRFRVLIEMESNTANVKPGMSGVVKVYGHSRPLGVRACLAIRDWFRSEVWW